MEIFIRFLQWETYPVVHMKHEMMAVSISSWWPPPLTLYIYYTSWQTDSQENDKKTQEYDKYANGGKTWK